MTREKIQEFLSEPLRLTYETQKKEQSNLNNAITDLTEFFYKENPRTEEIPYQYQTKNQREFYKSANVISLALSQVDIVLESMKTNMYNLEKGHQVIETPVGEQTQIIKQPEEKKPLISIPSFRKKSPPAPTLPFQSTLKLQKKTENVIYNWELVIHFQAYGVDLANDDFKHSDQSAVQYLTYHRNKFLWDIAPNILRIFKRGLIIQIDKEKELGLQALTANMKESFQTRNDFQLQPK